MLTRSGDYYAAISQRARIANAWKADIFLSIHCLPPGAMIEMADATMKPIEQVAVGDYVMNSSGMPVRVKRTFSRRYSGQIVGLRPYKTGMPLRLTPEHPVLTDRGNVPKYLAAGKLANRAPRDGRKEHYRVMSPILSFSAALNRVDLAQLLKPMFAFEIEDHQMRARRSASHRKAPSKTMPRFVEVDDDLLWLLGFYAGDGSTSLDHYSAVTFGFNLLKDQLKADRVARIIGEKFGLELSFRRRSGVHILQGWAVSYILARFFQHFVPGLSENRRIESSLMFIPPSKQRALLDGWIDADGTVYARRFKGDSISLDLASQMRQIALRTGLHPSFQVLSGLSGFNKSRESSYRILCNANDKDGLPPKGNVFFRRFENRLAVDLKSYELHDYEGEVFNLETETNSYTANHVAVHNCNADPDPDEPGMREAFGSEVWIFPGSVKGRKLAESLEKAVRVFFPDRKFRGIKEEELGVLRLTRMPAALLEVAFIDTEESHRLADPAIQRVIAEAIASALGSDAVSIY